MLIRTSEGNSGETHNLFPRSRDGLRLSHYRHKGTAQQSSWLPVQNKRITSSERRKLMKNTILFILGKALSLMLMGLAYLMLRRTVSSWFR